MSSYVLGVSFAGEELYGALVENTDDGETVVRFTLSSADPDEYEPELPGEGGFSDETGDAGPAGMDDDEDVTIQFGDDDGAQGGDPLAENDEPGADDGADAALIQSQLHTLLEACADRGYEDPEIALCSPVGEIDDVELFLPAEDGTSQTTPVAGAPLPAARSVLLDLLEDQYEGVVEDERVGFLPLRPTDDGRKRVLALIALPRGTVLSTLASMQSQTLSRRLRVGLLETEISLYEGLARSARGQPVKPDETTTLVRVGADDTFILFMRGDTLLKVEHLPELTTDDPVETICSRVLLLRDEYGVGRIHHLLLALEEHEDELARSFKEYFPDARTRLVRRSLPGTDEDEAERYTTAIGVALRGLRDPDVDTSFRPVDLLPADYAARSFRFPVEWSVPVLLGLIGLTTLGFVWYYVANAQAISERQARLEELTAQVERVERSALEGQTDTIEAAVSRYETGLETLDQLLKGSNKWSRQLAALTRGVNDVSGLSISQWRTTDGAVALTGRANDRSRVVELVRQLDAEIAALSFTTVREVTLYDFKITVPLDTLKPEATDYWKKKQATRLASANSGEDVPPQTDSGADDDSVGTDQPASQDRESASDDGTWIVVVASLSNRDAAETVQERYRTRLTGSDHGVRVHYSLEQGRYRVGVGGFPTRSRAQAGLQELKADLPPDAWIHNRSPASNDAPVASSSSDEQ